jgi:hypothetical protein
MTWAARALRRIVPGAVRCPQLRITEQSWPRGFANESCPSRSPQRLPHVTRGSAAPSPLNGGQGMALTFNNSYTHERRSLVASEQETQQAEAAATGTHSRRLTVELGCILCGDEFGSYQCSSWPMRGPVVVNRVHASHIQAQDWRRMRCSRCGGSVIPKEITQEVVRPEPRLDWADEHPRRGRPPRHVTSARRGQDATA